MTFALLGRCARTGQLGVAVTTSDIAVGARVPHAEAQLGVVVTQHRTDPRLGPRALALLRSGCTPQEVVDAVAASTAQRAWRQLGVLDAQGRSAAFSGERTTPVAAAVAGRDCLAVGNMLRSDGVAHALLERFADRDREPLAARLVGGLLGGADAGGETHPLRSAALLVVERQPFPLVDLRIDDDARPLHALARLWERYEPWAEDFVRRALKPDAARGQPDPSGPSSTST